MQPIDEGKVIDLTIRIGFLGLFIYGTLMMIAPLFGLMLWAVILAVAIYPLHAAVTRWLGGRRKLSAVLLTLLGIAITLGPVALLGAGIVEAGHGVTTILKAGNLHVPAPPEQIKTWPLIGPQLHLAWSGAHENIAQTLGKFSPQLLKVGEVALERLATVGIGIVTILLSVLISGVLLIAGEDFARGTRRFANRVFADTGAEMVGLASATVRNVSRGVIGVAVIQALLSGIIMAAFGLSMAGPLALIALVLSIIQIGPWPVLLPVIIWAFTSMDPGKAVLLALCLAPVMIVDNILKPIFMSRGLDTPMLVILIGLLGGLMAFGVVGIFVGPVILSVFYALFIRWIEQAEG
ncbi:AI-2E family transporter [Tropicimonas sp. IMCC6043]|uniref:AI-2E family transporter n=1 Tax=Tropicimonas sp. IMCC6043 TaxID=2510645 RepID=UPI0013EA8FF4|nr:AI-2E family transporter [Tropicimonas sp. IMCC6043]